MAERKLRIGMIGAGGISKIHCEAWTTHPQCELVAITDPDKDAALGRAETFHIETVELSAGRMLARKDIDVIDIVAPNRFHKKYTIDALEAGKHVFCEKPLGMNAREVDAMIAAAAKSKRTLMAGHHMRFQIETRGLQEYLATHPLGEIYYARAWYNRRRKLPGRPGFMYKKVGGGGCLIDVGVHMLDLAMYLMDNFKPVRVSGMAVNKLACRPETWSQWGEIDHQGMDVEDFGAAMIRFDNGAVLTLECSFLLNQKSDWDHSVDLFGAEAGAKWPDCEYYDHTPHDMINAQLEIQRGGVWPHVLELHAFADAVIDGKPSPIPPTQTRAVMAVIDGIYRSQRLGREVKL